MNKSFARWLYNQISSATNRRPRRRQFVVSYRLAEIQILDERVLLSGPALTAVPATDLNESGTAGPDVIPMVVPSGYPGYTPAQIRHAYGFDQISFNGTAGDGTGTTIAIVDAYDDPNITSDLHQFDLAFGLPDPPTFTKLNQSGSTSNLPGIHAGWALEIALDVEWAHAIAPGANIVLVEANTTNFSDFFAAVNTARNYAGVNVVSMSWGGVEFSNQILYDSFFTTPGGHQGVTFVASAGDVGAPTQFPSSSPNVVSVGGTTLTLSADGTWTSETAWSGSGGGISNYESQPSYQQGVVTQTSTKRADPDVAYDANPSTGFGVYDSYDNGTTNPWSQCGGTSAAAPQWAALIAIADQGRALSGKSSLDGPSQTLPLLYSMSANDFHDITSGTSTGTPNYSAGTGYDLVTGRGSPIANLVVNDLIGNPANPTPPTLTSVSTLATATRQVPFSISYATLLGASNAQDFNSAPIQFLINSVQNGTLTITHNGVTTAVVAGTTLFGTGDTLTWTSAAGAYGSTVNAFTVTAFDGSLSSASAVQVNINVLAPPTLTSVSTLATATRQVPFSISYATLLGASNAQDFNSVPIQFLINSVQNGTLTITHNGVTTAVAGTTLFGTGDTLIWTSAAGAYGSAVNAFTVTAFDGSLSSASAVQVNINVLAPPTLTSVSTLATATRQVPFSISYATLLGDSNAQDFNSAPIQFLINSVQNGTLTITHSGVTTAVVAGTTLFGTGDTLTWTSAAGAYGSAVNAFTVTAFDGSLSSASAVQVNINVLAPPTLTSVSTLGVVGQQAPFAINYAMLLGDSNAQDFNRAPIQFRINSVQNGTLAIMHNGVTAAVVPGTTLLGPGDSLIWTSATGVSGSAVNAFTVTVFDGTLSSSPAVQVTMNVQSFGPVSSLSGTWIVDSAGGVAQGLGQITQTGSNLSFVNFNGVSSSGQLTSSTQVVATNFDGRPSVTGTIDSTVADYGRILFADGTVWLRVSLAGTYSVSGPGISSPTLATITQNGTGLTLVCGSTSTSATISTVTQLLVSTGQNTTAAATYGDGKITFSNNGQTWTKLDLPANYTNQSGAAVQVLQNGTSITFVNKFGVTTPAVWSSPSTLFLAAWNESVTTGPGTLTFQDGSIWSMNLVLNGANNGTGTTTITAAPSSLYVFDYVNGSGKAVHLVQTGTNQVLFIFANQVFGAGQFISPTQLTTPVSPNDIATISNDFSTITWQDGTVWTQTAPTGSVSLTNATNAHGVATHLIQNGSTQVAFIDCMGNIIIGNQVNPGQFVTALYGPGDLATVSGNSVTWQDGSIWTPTNSSVPPTVTLTDQNGASFHVKLTSASTLIAVDGVMAGVSATRLNGKLFWSNGAVWNDFDFNALNALFEMATGYA